VTSSVSNPVNHTSTECVVITGQQMTLSSGRYTKIDQRDSTLDHMRRLWWYESHCKGMLSSRTREE